jgi:cellulose synthase/poly-beta-1,6-N-acetylglucosamine synthase-like glycosyltransferase
LPFFLFWVVDFARYMATDLIVVLDELWTRLFRKPDPSLPSAVPLVSVVMAGYNEAETMPLTLGSLAEQTYPNLEIVVVDDGSLDGTTRAVQDFLANPPPGSPPCRLVTLKRRNGKAAALNLGLSLARGDLIVYVDADTSFDRDAVEQIVRPMLFDPDVGAVGGNIVARNARENPLTQCVSLEYLFSISIGRRFRSMFNILHVISGAFGAFRRELVEAVGGHTPTSGNDGDLTLKLRRVSERIVFAHRALCMTKTPADWKPLVKQRRRWDRNLIKNKLRRHRDLLDLRSTRFRWANAFLVVDAAFFNLVMGFRWVVAFTLVAIELPGRLPTIALISYTIYLCGGAFQLAIAQWLQPPKSESRFTQWLYLPLYPLYKSFFRLVRLYSYVEELASQASYADVFAPRHVSLEALDYDNRGSIRLGQLIRSLLWPFGGRRASRVPVEEVSK